MNKPANLIEDIIPDNIGIRYPKEEDGKFKALGVCWHWTANLAKGADADNHRRLWERVDLGAHYALDDHQIIHCVPDNVLVWHCGPSSMYTPAIKKKYPRGANLSLIGVEMCVNADGNWAKTYQNAVSLGAYLCFTHGFNPYTDFVRHFDCTGKDCPRMWTKYEKGGEVTWTKFKRDVVNKMKERAVVGLFSDIANSFAKADIEELVKLGIMTGTSKDTFDPKAPMTREQAAAVINRTIKYVIKEVTK